MWLRCYDEAIFIYQKALPIINSSKGEHHPAERIRPSKGIIASGFPEDKKRHTRVTKKK
jgi:hypothetical protein